MKIKATLICENVEQLIDCVNRYNLVSQLEHESGLQIERKNPIILKKAQVIDIQKQIIKL